jgi:hypothetical protein
MRDVCEAHRTVEPHDWAETLGHESSTILESDRLRKMQQRSKLTAGCRHAMVPIYWEPRRHMFLPCIGWGRAQGMATGAMHCQR